MMPWRETPWNPASELHFDTLNCSLTHDRSPVQQSQPGCRTTHVKTLRQLGSSPAGFSTPSTRLGFSKKPQTPDWRFLSFALQYTYARKPGATGWALFLALWGVLVVGTFHALGPHSRTRPLRPTSYDRHNRAAPPPAWLAQPQADQEAYTRRGPSTGGPRSCSTRPGVTNANSSIMP
jgi:hypothetical protein